MAAVTGEFRSRFGGLWFDTVDVESRIDSAIAAGEIREAEGQQLRQFVREGVLVLENAVAHDVIDRIATDVEAAWAGHTAGAYVEHFVDGKKEIEPARLELRDKQAKLLDLYAYSEAARAAIFAEPVQRLLTILFREPPLAFQSLCMWRGTLQPAHQDSVFVRLRRPLEFVGSWLALEDIEPDTGELFYYLGSHTFDEYLFDGTHKSLPSPYDANKERAYLDSLERQAAERGLARTLHRPRKGDVILWHADLAHGGAPDMRPGSTRKSLVTHYCPLSNDPVYFLKELHSGKHRHASGGHWCHARFCDTRPGHDTARKALVAAKRAFAKFRWRVR